MHTFLDANSGEVVLEYNDLKKQTAAVGTGTGVLGDQKKISTTSASGRFTADDALRPPTLITFDMQGNLARVEAYLDGRYQPAASDVASDTDNVWTDAANLDAHVQLGLDVRLLLQTLRPARAGRQRRTDLRNHASGASQRPF